jgi:hypothetical protein
MDFSDQTIATIKDCRACEVAVCGDIRKHVQQGEKVLHVCRELELMDAQFHGEPFLSAAQYRNIYYNTFAGEKPESVLINTDSKTAEATKVVNSMVEKYKKPDMPSNFQDDIDVSVHAASQDTTTSILVDTEINDRVTKAFKMLDEVIGAWELSGKTFWLDLEYIKMNLARVQKKVEQHENKD